jgi:DNA-binding HxlR family transcriptional regulator
VCSITDALSIVGDRYALLVARELRYGRTRFQDIAAAVPGPRVTCSPPGYASWSWPA